MRHLHKYVLAKQVLYLGASDIPAWVVLKANECKHFTGFLRRSCAETLKLRATMVLRHSLSTKVVGMQLSETWKPRSFPCAKIKAWLSFPGQHLVGENSSRKNSGNKQSETHPNDKQSRKPPQKSESLRLWRISLKAEIQRYSLS